MKLLAVSPRHLDLLGLLTIMTALLVVAVSSFFVKETVLREKIEFSSSSLPVVAKPPRPYLTAKAYLVLDADSGTLLAWRNRGWALPPASLTKIVSALVVLDKYSLDEVLVVDRAYSVGRNISLAEGERMRAGDLLRALMIHSANDAAYVLAANYPGGVAGFVEAMNEKVNKLGFKRTSFINFDGEEDNGHFSTAFELAQLARLLVEDPFLAETVQLSEAEIYDIDGRVVHQLETTNELLGVMPEIKGLKTGWTQQAGECFIGLFEFEKDGRQRRVLTVILGSRDRFGETKKLAKWVKGNVSWQD